MTPTRRLYPNLRPSGLQEIRPAQPCFQKWTQFLHPYQPGPPEQRDGAFSYLERINALRSLLASYGLQKDIWATEANWIIVPDGSPNLTAPGHDEQDQAEYVVRVNLLSMAAGVKYFLTLSCISPLSAAAACGHLGSLRRNGNSLFESETTDAAAHRGAGCIWHNCKAESGTVAALWSVGSEATLAGSSIIGLQTCMAILFPWSRTPCTCRQFLCTLRAAVLFHGCR